LTDETTGGAALFAAAAAAATARAVAEPIAEDVIRTVVPEGYESFVHDLREYKPTPRRKSGRYEFDRADSFIAYVNMHKVPLSTTVFARGESFTAVLNAHGELDPGWEDHVACYRLVPTPAWVAWRKADQEWMEQEAFAEFLEDRIPDIVEPAGAVLMEIATHLRVKSGLNFQSSVKLANGAVQLTYEESIEASAGKKGDMAIPESLKLMIVPYEGVERQGLTARFRWRIANGKARFHYALGAACREVTEAVLTSEASHIEDGTELPVLYGGVG
jgi:uncharacterized protein YfdQ (DUF2303 family)